VNKPVLDFSDVEIQQMLDNLDQYTSDEIAEIDRMVEELILAVQIRPHTMI